jgi:hypothetical protein
MKIIVILQAILSQYTNTNVCVKIVQARFNDKDKNDFVTLWINNTRVQITNGRISILPSTMPEMNVDLNDNVTTMEIIDLIDHFKNK